MSEPENNNNNQAYWRANIRLMLILLAIWFTVSFGFGIILVDWLNQIQFFGFKFGFWWAQQGSIYVFVILIFVYTAMMKKIDRAHGVSDDDDDMAGQGTLADQDNLGNSTSGEGQ